MSERTTGATDEDVPWTTESTTGATDDQIERAAANAWGYNPESLSWADALDEDKYPIRADARWWAGNLVPPGQVIVDAARVPTDEELAAMRWIDANPFSRSELTWEHRRVLEVYLERQR